MDREASARASESRGEGEGEGEMAEEKPTEAAAPADAPPKEEGAEGAEGEAGEPKKKEHVVSIVLSYMNDEHEKAAIEVSRRTLSRPRRQPRSPDPDPDLFT